MEKKAFVTGGTGFVGVNLVELLTSEGWDVTALHRRSSDLTYLTRFPVQLREGSLTDKSSLEDAIQDGTPVVFHVAGSTNMWSKHNVEQSATNIDGTRNVVEVAVNKGVKKFIHTSTVSAWGNVTGVITEETPQRGSTSWINYERTKWQGEQEALRGVDRGMEVVVLNPTVIAGPYDTRSWGRLFFLLRRNALPGIPTGVLSITHVHEVVKAHLASVDKGRSGEKYILAGEDCTFADFVREAAEVSGASKLPKQVPTPILKLFARLSSGLGRITGKPPDMPPELTDMATRKGVTYSSKKAIRELGYRIVPMRDTIRDCYEWLGKEGLL